MKDDNEFRKCVHLGWNWVHLRSPGSEFAFGRSQYLISSFPFTWVLHFPTLEWQFPFTWVEYSRISEGINSRRFLRSHHSTSSTLLDVSSPSPIFPAPFYLFPPFWFNFFFWTLFDFSFNFFFSGTFEFYSSVNFSITSGFFWRLPLQVITISVSTR